MGLVERLCAVCRQRSTKTKLVRFVRQSVVVPKQRAEQRTLNEIGLDVLQILPGRGCYCHPQCLLSPVAGEKVVLSLFAAQAKEMTNAVRRGWMREVSERMSIQQAIVQRKADIEGFARKLREKDANPKGKSQQGKSQQTEELQDTIRLTLLVIGSFEEKVSRGEKGQKKLRLRL